jgi:hypothetical protein
MLPSIRGIVLFAALAALAASAVPLLAKPSVTTPRVGQVVHLSALQRDTTFFDVEGYYFPSEALDLAGYHFDSFSFENLDFRFGLGPDSAVYSPHALLVLTRTEQDTAGYEADSVVLSPDSLHLVFRNTPIGEIRVAGSFLDKRGRFASDPDIDPGKTPVLQARVSVISRGRAIDSRRVVFTYWEGD